MKHFLFALLLSLAVASCSKKSSPAAHAAADAQKANEIATELRTLEQQEEKLRREIELERLAMEREELRLQRDALQNRGERLSDEEWALEKEKVKWERDRATAAAAEVNATAAAEAEKEKRQAAPVPASTPQVAPAVSDSSTGDYDYSIFYERLGSQGSWFQSPDYGYVWSPSICRSDRNWRPYTVGRWVYTDLGWTWSSAESFGWATYHYGRWVLLRNTGWCWIPGSQWAPAWVCWKSGAEYVGWAPLPPESLYWRGSDWQSNYGHAAGISPSCFSFVRISTMGSAIVNVVLPLNDCLRIYQQTNYCGGYRWDQRRVHCEGLSYDFVSRQVSTPLPRYQCDFVATPPTHLDPLRYVATRGERMNIHAPDFHVPWNGALRPRTIESQPLQDEVIRENNIATEVRERFAQERRQEMQRAEQSMRTGLSRKMSERIALREKISLQREELSSTLQDVSEGNLRSQSPESAEIGDSARTESTGSSPLLSGPSGLAKEGKRPGRGNDFRGRDEVNPPVAPMIQTEPMQQPRGDQKEPTWPQTSDTIPMTEGRQEQASLPREPSVQEGNAMRRAQEQAARVQQQIDQDRMQNQNRLQQERMADARKRVMDEQRAAEQQALKKAEQTAYEKKQSEAMEQETRMNLQAQEREKQQTEQVALEEARRQQTAVMREAEEKAREEQALQQQEAMREQQGAARQEQEAMREQQEATRQEQLRQQQEAMREQQEAARQEQLRQQQEAMREQQEATRQEQLRQQQEAMREQQEAARQEQQRQQQEAMREQQEAARQEQLRQQQEAMREQQEAARQEQLRQQQEAMREQQEAARQEQLRQQQEAMREQQEAAREQQMRQQQESMRERQEQQRQRESESAEGLRRFR